MSRSLPYLSLVTVVVLGVSAWWQSTMGLRAFTWESHRRLQVEANPLPVPDIRLEDHASRIIRLDSSGNRVQVINFIYTRCPTVCGYTGHAISRMQKKLRQQGDSDRVRLLSISLDPQYDTPERMKQYLHRFSHNPTGNWRIVRPVDPAQGDRLLQQLGVVSIPDDFGGITHNAAMHIVDQQGRLVRIIDEERIDAVLETLSALLANNPTSA